MSSLEDDACIRCGKTLDHDKSKWLELNHATSLYCDPGKVPRLERQTAGDPRVPFPPSQPRRQLRYR